MIKQQTRTLALLLALVPFGIAIAQGASRRAAKVDAATRTAVIASLTKQLHANYVFPDVAEQASAAARWPRTPRAAMPRPPTPKHSPMPCRTTCAHSARTDISGVGFAPGYHPHPTTLTQEAPSQADQEQMRQQVASAAYGIQRVERLNGNVGYMELRGVRPHRHGG